MFSAIPGGEQDGGGIERGDRSEANRTRSEAIGTDTEAKGSVTEANGTVIATEELLNHRRIPQASSPISSSLCTVPLKAKQRKGST
jgi:hypothetical protein